MANWHHRDLRRGRGPRGQDLSLHCPSARGILSNVGAVSDSIVPTTAPLRTRTTPNEVEGWHIQSPPIPDISVPEPIISITEYENPLRSSPTIRMVRKIGASTTISDGPDITARAAAARTHAHAVAHANAAGGHANAVAHADAAGGHADAVAYADAVGGHADAVAHADAVGGHANAVAHANAVGADATAVAHADAAKADVTLVAHADTAGTDVARATAAVGAIGPISLARTQGTGNRHTISNNCAQCMTSNEQTSSPITTMTPTPPENPPAAPIVNSWGASPQTISSTRDFQNQNPPATGNVGAQPPGASRESSKIVQIVVPTILSVVMISLGAICFWRIRRKRKTRGAQMTVAPYQYISPNRRTVPRMQGWRSRIIMNGHLTKSLAPFFVARANTSAAAQLQQSGKVRNQASDVPTIPTLDQPPEPNVEASPTSRISLLLGIFYSLWSERRTRGRGLEVDEQLAVMRQKLERLEVALGGRDQQQESGVEINPTNMRSLPDLPPEYASL